MTVTAGRPAVSPARESVTMTVGEFLLRRIREAGVSHAFGVPGDYNLELLQQLEDTGTLEWIGTCNELNASYAADGYARLNGLAALIVTNAVGALSAINGVAGSYVSTSRWSASAGQYRCDPWSAAWGCTTRWPTGPGTASSPLTRR